MTIIPVILAGGSGTRLWPLSRKYHPKQFLPLAGKKSMLQETLLRLQGLDQLTNPVIVCNNDHRFIVAEQLLQIKIKNSTILLEPSGRNSAPAIAAAAINIIKNNQHTDSVMLVLSADHVIENVDTFHAAIDIACLQAKLGKLVTFGIPPDGPNTEYGYIKYKKVKKESFHKVISFIEKPNLDEAKKYILDGNYHWNSGMFMFKAETLVDELKIYCPNILSPVSTSVYESSNDLDFIRLERHAFESSPSDSIDYALMEKSKNVVVVPLNASWSDVGTWSALYDLGDKDGDGNVLKGDIFTENTTNCYIQSDRQFIGTIGLQDLIIINTRNATLISNKAESSKVKIIVDHLNKENRDEQNYHTKVHRPWGWYESIESGKHFQVKRLHVNPGAKLSLQMHHKRSEHWVVVKGIATATNGENILTLTEGESTFIPATIKHTLENCEDIDLELIEVQSGTYLGEDDIVRFEDSYGRE